MKYLVQRCMLRLMLHEAECTIDTIDVHLDPNTSLQDQPSPLRSYTPYSEIIMFNHCSVASLYILHSTAQFVHSTLPAHDPRHVATRAVRNTTTHVILG
jgi:hypothetical protein